jgi:TonB-dependent receptor
MNPKTANNCRRQKITLTWLIGLLALAVAPIASAQSAESKASVRATGTIEGRVLNADTGSYIRNAYVAVDGTSRNTLTDSTGWFRLVDVPAGEVSVKVAYSGFSPQTATVMVVAGQEAEQNFRFGGTAQGDGKTLVLDPYVITARRDTDARSIAANEQRYSPNIKNVVAADAYGDLTEGNVGEMLKSLPGVAMDYVGPDARTVAVRGFGSNFTTVTADGAQMASAENARNRVFEFETVSVNNISRVEVTKVPTPSISANSLGGSVNLVSKSAFEADRTQFRYKAYFSMNSDETKLFKKTPGPGNKPTYHVLPGFDFNYIAPLTENFGIVLSGLSSNIYYPVYENRMSWRDNGGGGTQEAPYLLQYDLTDSPKTTFRKSVSLQADWRPAKNHVISVGLQYNHYHAFFDAPNTTFRAGLAPEFGPDFTHSESGGTFSQVTQNKYSFDKFNQAAAFNIAHRYRGELWEIDSGINASDARGAMLSGERGHFWSVTTRLNNVSRVNFDNSRNGIPGKITVFDASGNEIDWANLNNYTITGVNNANWRHTDEFKAGRVNVKRRLDFLPFEASLKTGFLVQEQQRDLERPQTGMTFVGPDGLPNTADDNAGLYVDAKSVNRPDLFGIPHPQTINGYALWDIFIKHPGWFSQTLAEQVGNETGRINSSFALKETISAVYLEGEARLWRQRLRVLGGVRFEKTEDQGTGPLFDPAAIYQRNADGSFVDGDPAMAGVQKVRKPEAGAPNSLEQLALQRKYRGQTVESSYDGYYPSLHLTFNITDNLLLRAAYARTLGRPNLSNILPNTTINENQDTEAVAAGALGGTISVVNTGLKPYTADNYDLSLEYYFPKGGVISVGGFQKDLTDFFGSFTQTATPELLAELGLEDRYVGWNINTSFNVDRPARVRGVEFNYNQPLTFLPGWGRHFNVNANYTKLKLAGPEATSFSGFIPETANLGLTFSKNPVVLMVKWNYRGLQRRTGYSEDPLVYGNFVPSSATVDVNAEYQLTKHVSLFANARNIFDANITGVERFNANTPEYAKTTYLADYGIQMVFGIKGTF